MVKKIEARPLFYFLKCYTKMSQLPQPQLPTSSVLQCVGNNWLITGFAHRAREPVVLTPYF